jgi:hypothetical protein
MIKYELFTWPTKDASPNLLIFTEEPPPPPSASGLHHYELYRLVINEDGAVIECRCLHEWDKES